MVAFLAGDAGYVVADVSRSPAARGSQSLGPGPHIGLSARSAFPMQRGATLPPVGL